MWSKYFFLVVNVFIFGEFYVDEIVNNEELKYFEELNDEIEIGSLSLKYFYLNLLGFFYYCRFIINS